MGVARPHFDEPDSAPTQPWHNRTGPVVGASLLALVVIGLGALLVTTLVRADDPAPPPLRFTDPAMSERPSGAATTTATITTTRPIETTDIDLPSASPESPTDDQPGTTAATPDEGTERITERERRDDDDRAPTTRRTPRTNVTRNLNPFH